MSVLLLTAVLPVDGSGPRNAGAHRLAWWLSARDDRWGLLARGADIPPPYFDRLLGGELIPQAPMVERIAIVTEGAVLPEDWDARADGAWDARPALRTREKAA